MSVKRILPLAVLAALVAGSVGRAEDEGTPVGTTVAASEGWKGVSGAKDPGEPGKAPGWVEAELKLVPVEKDWAFRTPRDSAMMTVKQLHRKGAWIDVTDGKLPLTGVRGGAMRFEPRGGKIMVDTGSGQFDAELRGEMMQVRIKCADGSEGPYWFRLKRDDDVVNGSLEQPIRQYLFMRACMATGKIDGTEVAFIDENNNGSFGDSLADAVRVGATPAAQAMSDLLNVKNKLYYIHVNQAGTKAWWKPYDGPTGTVDLATKYKGKSKPLFVMLKQGDVVVDAVAKDTVLPVGTWTLDEGLVGPTPYQCARIHAGKMKPIEVKKDEPASLAWGMPGILEFSVTKNGNQLSISSSSIEIYGQGGERYEEFRPKSFTPSVIAVEERSKRQVYQGNMGFGC